MSILNEIYHKEKFMKKLFSIFLSVIIVAASLSFSASVSAADSYYDTVKSGKNSDGYYVIKADSVDDLFDAFDTAKNNATNGLYVQSMSLVFNPKCCALASQSAKLS